MAESDTDALPIFIDVSSTTGPFPSSSQSQLNSDLAVNVEVKTENEEKQENDQSKKKSSETDKPSKAGQGPLKVTTMNGERYKCTECNRYSAETEEQVQRHIRKMHRGQNPFQCYMCDYSTYNKPLFEEHVRIHKGIKPFKCPHCAYRSASKKNAKKHALIHRADNPLKCPVCPFIAKHLRSFNHHRQQHTKDSEAEVLNKLKKENGRESADFPCEHCGTDFASVRNLASHQRNLKKCEQCDLVLCSKHMYKKHMSSAHSRSVEDDGASFRCSACPWRGSHAPRVLLHLVHHPAQSLEPPVDVSLLRTFGIMP